MTILKAVSQNVHEKIQTIVISSFCLTFYSVFVYINSQNVIGPQSLFMDEKLIYDGINLILNPQSLPSFSYAVFDGGDQRYGRLLWNLISLFAFIPNLFWGASGIIFIERMLGSTAIIFSFLILVRLYARNIIVQSILLIIMFVMPFTIYYATTPKPEPLMLLFLSLYLRHSMKIKSFLGSHWIYLGIVLGLKISGFFIVAAVCAYIFYSTLRSKIVINVNDLIKSIGMSLLGVAVTIPTLYSLGLLGLFLFMFSEMRITKKVKAWMKLILLIAFALSIQPSFQSFKNYYVWTFNSTSHGSDSEQVNIVTWLRFLFDRYLNASTTSLALLVLLIILASIMPRRKNVVNSPDGILLAVLLFLFTTIPIVLYVERLWGFYLWIGSIFFTCAIAQWTQMRLYETSKSVKAILLSVAIMFTISSSQHAIFASEVKNLSTIEVTDDFRIQEKRYKGITTLLKELSSMSKEKFKVAYDPVLWVPNSTSRYEISLFWGPFMDWNNGFDLLVLSSSHLEKEIDYSRSDSPMRVLEVAGLKRHLVESNQSCFVENCYTVVAQIHGVTILKLLD